MPGNYVVNPRSNGEGIDAPKYLADHQLHIDNLEPAKIDDYSGSVGQMQASTDPGELSSESQPTSLAGELERLRFAIRGITGMAQWYQTPTVDLSILGQGQSVVTLTNKTATTLASGQVVGLSAADDSAVVLVDTLGAIVPALIATEAIAVDAAGRFVQAGLKSVAVTGTIVRGHYVIKSATTKTVEDSGIAAGTDAPPSGALGIALTANAGGFVTVLWWGVPVVSSVGAFVQGHLAGLTLSNNVTDATNDLDIATGSCRSDDNTANFTLASALTKRLDATWAVGTNQGGLDTGTKANSTWYHVWAIQRVDTGVADVLFSLSVTAPTMPASYTKKRLIDSIHTNSSGVIEPFGQDADRTWWKTRALEVDLSGTTSLRLTHTVRTPLGRVVWAMLQVSGVVTDYPLDASVTDDVASDTVAPLQTVRAQGASYAMAKVQVRTNLLSEVVSRSQNNDNIKIVTEGWLRPR